MQIEELDPHALTKDEVAQGVTKLRYMQFREQRSSSASLGFRIEGVRTLGSDYPDCKNIRSKEQIMKALRFFLQASRTNLCCQELVRLIVVCRQSHEGIQEAFLARLKHIRDTLSTSEWFMTHEVVGSSILFVYDDVIGDNRATVASASAHMIDFAKIEPLPQGGHLTHTEEWTMVRAVAITHSVMTI